MKLKELRQAKGMTQADLARAVKASKPTVCMWESGARKPGLDYLLALADVLGCSVDVILGRNESSEQRDAS
ncbi:helix-turn-helix transcriptional regulator [uncultured Flavonifractor sp.]|uniref:helix-turn-helix transcriptional regulator n=1 Tax=uncultured Flavonifractor sp. TaxID=1193534 RepID=UPI002625C1FB|nr:helix-turn-helix transcriptional regulator [uncultured Flavonifractor sp.]